MTITDAKTAPPSGTTTASASALARLRAWDSLGLFSVFVLLTLTLSLTAPNFLTSDNLLNILQQAAFFGVIAFAMTLVIVAGEIDISVGSQAALASSVLGVLVGHWGWPMWASCLLVLLSSALIGAAAGWIRARFDVPTFIVTLALYLALRGVAMLITDAFPIPIDSHQFFYWGSGKILGQIPVSALYMIGVFAAIAVISRKTVFGRSVYAVGGNPKASALSGINVSAVRVIVLVLSAVAAAVTGLLQSAQLASGNPSIANGLEFDAISATIIGGASLNGGRGTVSGTFIGVLFIAVLSNGMVLLGVNPFAQNVVRGGVVLVAVLIAALRRSRMTAKDK